MRSSLSSFYCRGGLAATPLAYLASAGGPRRILSEVAIYPIPNAAALVVAPYSSEPPQIRRRDHLLVENEILLARTHRRDLGKTTLLAAKSPLRAPLLTILLAATRCGDALTAYWRLAFRIRQVRPKCRMDAAARTMCTERLL